DEIVLSYGKEPSEFYTEIFDNTGSVAVLDYGSNRMISALVDLNNDNYVDIITGGEDGKIRAYDVEHDTLLWERQTEGPINCSPAVGDIHPGVPYPGVEITFGNDASEIHLRRGINGANIDPWPYTIDPGAMVRTSPAIANINGDSYLDIIIGANNGYVYAFKHTKDSIPPFPLPLFGRPSSPIIGDIDGDRKSEIILSSSDGYLHVWENRDSRVTSYSLEWPQFHHDHQRTGLYGWQ
ncbi:MAG: VCBS repeat-containing protein, partial [bacterium]